MVSASPPRARGHLRAAAVGAAVALAFLCGQGAAVSAATPARVTLGELLSAGSSARPLTAIQRKRALHFNSRRWTGVHRRELLGFLRGEPVTTRQAHFSAADIAQIVRVQRGAGLAQRHINGRVGRATSAALLWAGMRLSPLRASTRHTELWFYPGSLEDMGAWRSAKQRGTATAKNAGRDPYSAITALAPRGTGILYVVVGDNVVDLIEARGGPPFRIANGSHRADPSRPGRYRLEAGKPHRSDNWIYSQIEWGAALREHAGEIEYRAPGSHRWRVATGPSTALAREIPRQDFFDENGDLMKQWRLNDFGQIAFRLRGSPGLLIHTTPLTEDKAALGHVPALPTSHGCLHVPPAERDRLIRNRYLRRGVTVVIKRYRDHLLPRALLRRSHLRKGA